MGTLNTTSSGASTGDLSEYQLKSEKNAANGYTGLGADSKVSTANLPPQVTNGDSHDHDGGDGAQIDHTKLSNKGTKTHAQLDTATDNSTNHIAASAPHSGHEQTANKGQANGYAGLDASTKLATALLPTIDHTTLSNKGTNTHAQIDTAVTNSAGHIANNSNPHTTTHAQLSDKGTNTHAQIDTAITASTTHIAAANPHSGHEQTANKGQANGYCALGADGKVPSANLPSTSGGGSKGEYTYLADVVGGNIVITDQAGSQVSSNPVANALTVVNALIAGATAGDIIALSPSLNTAINGKVTISKAITLRCGSPFDAQRVWINQIEIKTAGSNIVGVKLEGLCTYMLIFDCADAEIRNVRCSHMMVFSNKTTTSEGIVFQGSNTYQTHNIYFDHFYFYDNGQSARKGFISFLQKNGGNGQIYFESGTYSAYGNAVANVFIAYEGGGCTCMPVVIGSKVDIVTKGTSTGFTLVQINANTTNTYPFTGGIVIFENRILELHDITRIIDRKTDGNAYPQLCDIKLDGISISNDAGGVYLFDFDNYDNYTYIDVLGCDFDGSNFHMYDALSYLGDQRYFRINFANNRRFENIIASKITTPFQSSGANYQSLGFKGSAAAPTASTEYRVCGGKFLVNSTGGTGVSITIKDESGNTVASGLTTLTQMLLPNRYTINFGAFSAAPTVTAQLLGGA